MEAFMHCPFCEETQLVIKNVEEAALVRGRFQYYLTASEKAGEPG